MYLTIIPWAHCQKAFRSRLFLWVTDGSSWAFLKIIKWVVLIIFWEWYMKKIVVIQSFDLADDVLLETVANIRAAVSSGYLVASLFVDRVGPSFRLYRRLSFLRPTDLCCTGTVLDIILLIITGLIAVGCTPSLCKFGNKFRLFLCHGLTLLLFYFVYLVSSPIVYILC